MTQIGKKYSIIEVTPVENPVPTRPGSPAREPIREPVSEPATTPATTPQRDPDLVPA